MDAVQLLTARLEGIDMKPVVRKVIALLALCVLAIDGTTQAQDLYGIVGAGGFPHGRQLIRIDTATGAATLVGDTGISIPEGLAYNPDAGLLYAIGSGMSGRIYRVNTADASIDVLPASGSAAHPMAIAYRSVDHALYAVHWAGPADHRLQRIDPLSGALITDVGTLGAIQIQGLSARPSDGVLFGATTDDDLVNIATAPTELPTLVTLVAHLHRLMRALAFHPDGTLYGTDGSNLYTINLATGAETLIGPFGGDINTVSGLAFVTEPGPETAEVWIKDCAADTGTVSSLPLCPQWWTSPDIWIDNDGDMVIDAPVVGADNRLVAVVRNRAGDTANDVRARFYYRDSSTGLRFPDGANLIGEDTVTVLPWGFNLATVVWHALPAPPGTGGHWCIGVVLDHPDDPPVSPAVQPTEDNNVGMANLWFIAGRAGEPVLLGFDAGTGGKSGFGLTPWPREFVLKVIDELPPGWSWEMEGAPAGEPFLLHLGRPRPIQVQVKVPADAAPHSGGALEVRQIDVETGTVVGGVRFDLYEDHLPPMAVGNIGASVVDGRVVLTWVEVMQEEKSGLRERVAYYEVLRDGKPAAKVLRDQDPSRPGIQWADRTLVAGMPTYAVRVVDEGGNVSALSPAVTVKVAGMEPDGRFGRLIIGAVVVGGFLWLLGITRRTT